MKKMIMAATAAMLATSALAFDVTVGVERATMAGETNTTLAVSQPFGGLTFEAQADVSMNDGSRGDVRQYNLDVSYELNKSTNVFIENDFDTGGDRTETTIGLKYTF